MKRTSIYATIAAAAMLAAAAPAAGAQTLMLRQGSVTYAVAAAQAGEMTFADGGASLLVMGRSFALDAISEAYVDSDYIVEDNSVTVGYDGSTASVTIAGNIAAYVDATVDGAHISIVQSGLVGADTCGEITYSLSGTSSDGSFALEGSYKASVELNGLSLTNPAGAAIDIQNGKRIELSVKSGTVNSLTDGADGSQKGCLVCKGHLELKGKGSLNVSGNKSHGIYAKEYVTLKNCTVNVLSAVKDGLNCNQYFAMESGALNIAATGDDGLQVSFKDDTDREAEDTGSIIISGGSIDIAISATAAKGLKADGDVAISGGDIKVASSGGGMWDSDKLKTKGSTCISADGTVTIDGGTLSLTATGSAGKGISCDGALVVNDGDITVSTSGGMFVYTNGTEYPDYTGNTDHLDSDSKSSPKGIKSDSDVTINGGTIHVTTTGYGGEGIESKALMTINGGTLTINSYDDGLNSSGHMYIKGGDITVVATDNDAIDSNGNMYISGGYIRAFGASAPECGIDANEEEGYSVHFTGGTLLAVGGGNSVPSSAESTQPYVSTQASLTAGSTVSISDGSTVLATFTVPDNYSASAGGGGFRPAPGGNRPGGGGGGAVLISCAGLSSGSSYSVSCGGSTSSATATLRGSSQGGGPGGWRP